MQQLQDERVIADTRRSIKQLPADWPMVICPKRVIQVDQFSWPCSQLPGQQSGQTVMSRP
jgi:hypothetical protein